MSDSIQEHSIQGTNNDQQYLIGSGQADDSPTNRLDNRLDYKVDSTPLLGFTNMETIGDNSLNVSDKTHVISSALIHSNVIHDMKVLAKF